MKSLKVLMYHNIDRAPPQAKLKGLYITPRQFESQVRLLYFLGFQSVTSTFLPENGKKVLFTFDDGYRDFLEHAHPILVKYGYRGHVFVPASLVGKYNCWDAHRLNVRKEIMSWSELHFLIRQGHTVGSHSLTHRKLTELSSKELEKEVLWSKRILEDQLGVEVDTFCYPYGAYDERVVHAVSKAGYKYAFTTEEKPFSLESPHQIGRIKVVGNQVFVQLSFLKRLWMY